jgi:diguanylate cyclase (GGDEF)-like protein/PAS domain S-box-containing protein
MARPRLHQSVVTRLVACLVLGGLLASAGTSFLEISRSEPLLQMEVTQQVVLVTRNLQTVLRGLIGKGQTDNLPHTLDVFTANAPITAVRLQPSGGAATVTGKWPDDDISVTQWTLGAHATASGTEIDMQRPTHVLAPFHIGDDLYSLEFMVDGPGARAAMRSHEINRLLMHWLFLAVTVLLGLLLVRRWFTGPLSNVVTHVRDNAGAQVFHRLSREYTGEFAQLSESIGGMLTRIESTAQALRVRERAFEHLYQFAPAAMISIDKSGKIIEANRRAADLFGDNEQALVGLTVLDFIRREDRPLLRQTIDRLNIDAAARCELSLDVRGGHPDVAVECAAVRDDDGILQSVRLSLLDVSEAKLLHRQLAEQTQLLNLIINHMSDAILLVDSAGKVAAFNQQLLSLLHVRPESLRGASYDAQTFWDDLGPLHPELLVNRLRQIEADTSRPAIERVETRVGTFMFQGIPVHDASQACVGRLWVVQETTTMEQNQRLLSQQTSQLQALKRLGHELAKIEDVADVQEKASELLYRIFDVEAVGIALRSDDPARRSRQIMHRGTSPYLLGPSADLVKAIETRLMRQVLDQSEIMFWPDLPKGMDWSKAFTAAGLTCLAAGPLRAGGDDQGILWIARRGGERLERQHIYLLETLLPVIAARIEVAQLHERMRDLELTDPVTELPAVEPFRRAVHRMESRPGQTWAVITLKLDHFRKVNEALSHDAADRLLREIAHDLSGSVRRSCFVARLEGVTFGVIAPAHDLNTAVTLAQRLRQRIGDHHITLPDGTAWRLSACVGVCAMPDDQAHRGRLIELALHRTNLAVAHGRNRVVYEGSITPDRAAG